ncbi:MAG TPA: hypothetical protein VFW93_06750 [Aquabacterium sp.]|uniref:hypothetical protein n=1 Tax=Aquabacterium sp. TaxID=1872578 RepID=UPI002E32C522|nr:hypothetical protein [Aquabacterium sp.]HEX5355896.1 hypothetical protein [Aquabacterium sp.]
MSQNHGGRLVRQSTSDKPGRPSLDRPSLFAGMDNEDSTFGGDTQRVRILSTLESTRRPARRKKPMTIHGVTRPKRSNWQTKALIGLMGVGVLTLLASFVMVIVDGHSGPARTEQPGNKPSANAEGIKRTSGLTPKVKADTSNPLAALIAPPQHPAMAPAPQQAAVIENVINTPPAMPPTDTKVAAVNPAQAPGTMQPGSAAIKPVDMSRQTTSVATAAPTAATPKLAAATPTPLPAAKAQPQAPAHDAATTASTSGAGNLDTKLSMPPPARRTPASKSKDEDVALLEAMFAHTRPRPAPATLSVAEELKQRCGSLSGAEAATCRARVCVQNPTAAACHQD